MTSTVVIYRYRVAGESSGPFMSIEGARENAIRNYPVGTFYEITVEGTAEAGVVKAGDK
jgi:hypothetical protein